ncbi:hypothetical protein Bca52824_036184 [Brassica carinata]|uniref:ALOG domain-containing protein n=1 Tax=Brassica carinata TaxID=52824 RepID=A0A8X7S4R9_BRACI|nr:hypothetical protein Bca52824_036184 [Brassica carinata]
MEGETTGKAAASSSSSPSHYESQKRRDWNTFLQYLKNHKPPLTLSRCSGAHVIEFLKYLDKNGKTRVHVAACPFFGEPNPPSQCICPLRQAWGSLDSLVGRLRAAFEEIGGGLPESNPLAAKAVGIYLKEVRGTQAKARGIPYGKKKRKLSRTAKATLKADDGEGGGGSGGSALVVSATVV